MITLRLGRAAAAMIGAALIAGCEEPIVTWGDARSLPPADSSGALMARLSLDTAGHASMTPSPVPRGALPGSGAACAGTLRLVAGRTGLSAVWWTVRSDSSAVLHSATSADSGDTWPSPVVVDSTDRSDVGCTRPAPSIAATGGGVYIAYSMQAVEGTGVFLSHTMDAPGMRGMFHAPVIVIYGDRLVRVAVATDGDRVAVAYEDPSAKQPRIDLALSLSQGHVFETHAQASTTPINAADPDVALAGARIAVSWTAVDGRRVIRNGHIR